MSPDGRWAIAKTSANADHLDVIPTGAGQAVRLERAGLNLLRARWLADGRRIVVRARRGGGPARLYVLDTEGRATRPVTPDGLPISQTGWAVSPDSAMVALSTGQRLELFPIDGGAPRRVPGAAERWHVVGWIESGLLVSADPAAGGIVSRVDPATGRTDTWADIQPEDPSGIMNLDLSTLAFTSDGRGYGYTWHRATSDLYLVEGWA